MTWKAALQTMLVLGLGIAIGPQLATRVQAQEAAAAPSPPPSALPQWYEDQIAFMTQQSGRWIADNSQYKSETEPFDAFGMEWTPGIGGKSLKGRLFALRDGQEVATFWEFRTFWHPGEKEVVILQFGGNGVVGPGTVTSEGPGKTRSVQEFFRPDGGSTKVLHESEQQEGGIRITRAYDLAPDGATIPRRTYIWKVQP